MSQRGEKLEELAKKFSERANSSGTNDLSALRRQAEQLKKLVAVGTLETQKKR